MEFRKPRKILIITLTLNWAVALAKILVGSLTGALSILTDGFHSLFDGMSNILGLLGLKAAEHPKDAGHPYGHLKFEAFSALAIAFLILIASYEFLKSAAARFLNPVAPDISFLSFLVMGGTLCVDAFVYFYESRQGKKLKSTILIADSLHTKTHFFITPAVILGMVAIKKGYLVLDPLIALAVILMLGKLAWEIIKHVAGILCDKAAVDEKRVKRIVGETKGVRSCHEIRSRGDQHHVFLDMHVSLDSDLSLEQAHRISRLLKKKIIKELPGVKDIMIHIEPEGKGGCQCG